MPDRPRDTPAHGVHVVRGEVPEGVVPPSTSMRPPEPAADASAPREHTGGNAEDCPVCRPWIDLPGGVLYPWLCTDATEEGETDA